MISRRGFLGGLLAAPFVVRSGILMPIESGVIVPEGLVHWGKTPLRGGLICPRKYLVGEGGIEHIIPKKMIGILERSRSV